MKIIHVVESFGGGVATALGAYTRSMPDAEHILLRAVRADSAVDPGILGIKFSKVLDLPIKLSAARRYIRQIAAKESPDVIHAHSSYAGLFVRTAINSRQCRVVYTPHGYSFERRDVGYVIRSLFRLAEFLLSLNTTAVAACSPRELQLTQRLNPWLSVEYVPNVAFLEMSNSVHREPDSQFVDKGNPLIVTVARVTPAKDPAFYTQVKRIVEKHIGAEFVWVGGGDEDLERVLIESGTSVTGWLQQDAVHTWLSRADVVLQTSRWESMPMTLLEAEALGVPAVVRRVESMPWVPRDASSETPEGVAKILIRVLQDSAYARNISDIWHERLKENNINAQRAGLLRSYLFDPSNE